MDLPARSSTGCGPIVASRALARSRPSSTPTTTSGALSSRPSGWIPATDARAGLETRHLDDAKPRDEFSLTGVVVVQSHDAARWQVGIFRPERRRSATVQPEEGLGGRPGALRDLP